MKLRFLPHFIVAGVALFVWVWRAEPSRQFRREPWNRCQLADTMIKAGDASVLLGLEDLLQTEDRQEKACTAYLFAGLGDRRGFVALAAIVHDFGERTPRGGGVVSEVIPSRDSMLTVTITQDRDFAISLLGRLKRAESVPILASVLRDTWVAASALHELRKLGNQAIEPLLECLHSPQPLTRSGAIYAVQELRFKQAIPVLRTMLNDTTTGLPDDPLTIGARAQEAIRNLEWP